MTALAGPPVRKPPVASKPLRPAPPSRLHGSDVLTVVAGVVVVTTALWIRDGGVGALADGAQAAWLSVADLTGLWAGLAGLAGLTLVARPRGLERRYGLDRMLGWHRWTGTALVWATAVHALASLIAYEGDSGRSLLAGLIHQSVAIQSLDWMVAATVATALFVVVGLTSWRRLRRRMSYETWYLLHVLGYLAVVLALGHALVLGTDIAGDRWAIGWWVGLHLVVLCLLLTRRFAPLVGSLLRPRLSIGRLEASGGGLTTVTVTGPGIATLQGRAGQWYRLRLGGRGWWWQSHPYSASAVPTVEGVQFTVAAQGDGACALATAAPGTRIWLEGPYGVFTRAAAHGRPLLLIGGGSGLAPLRALLQEAAPADRPVLIVRARDERAIPYRGELEHLTAVNSGQTYHALGRTAASTGDVFDPAALRRAIPDLAARAAFLCGPAGMVAAARKGLVRAGLDPRHIHAERYDY